MRRTSLPGSCGNEDSTFRPDASSGHGPDIFAGIFRAACIAVLATAACNGADVIEPDPPNGQASTLIFSTFEQNSWAVATAHPGTGATRAFPLPVENPGDYPDIRSWEPKWNPDGRRVVYRASNTGTDNWYLVLTDTAGSFKRLLTGIGGYAEGHVWSPRGDRLLYHWGGFVGGRGGTAIQTAIVDTLGNRADFFVDGDGEPFEGQPVFFGLLPIADSSGWVPALYEAAWAPDGEHLYMVGTIGRRAWDPGLRVEDVEVFRVSVSTRRVVERVTHNDVPERTLRLAPDAAHLLLTVRRETMHPVWDREEGEYVMPLAGRAADMTRVAELLTFSDAPQWSTDGRHVSFTRPTGVGGYPEIYLYDIETGSAVSTGVSGFWPHLFATRQ